MIGHKRIPSREGGIEVVVEELGQRLVQCGEDITCYNRKGKSVNGQKIVRHDGSIYKGMKIREVPTLDKKGMAAVTASFSAAVMAAFGNYDIVHFHAEGPSFMCWIPKLFGKKVVVTIHGLDHQRAKWGNFASRYILQGEKNAVKYADEIIVLSKNMQDYFLEKYNRKTHYIPNGVKMPKNIPARRITQEYGLKKDDYLLYLGRLVPEKGVDLLIKAYVGMNTEKKLVIAGAGSDSLEYEKLIRKAGVGENIIFTGFVEGELQAELYSNAYCYVLPSYLEGMPLSLLEAMSYGCYCVVSDIPECAGVVGEYGEKFKCGNVLSLREKLQSLCDAPLQVKKRKENVANYICKKYCWDDVTIKTIQLYKGIGKGNE